MSLTAAQTLGDPGSGKPDDARHNWLIGAAGAANDELRPIAPNRQFCDRRRRSARLVRSPSVMAVGRQYPVRHSLLVDRGGRRPEGREQGQGWTKTMALDHDMVSR